MKLNLDYELKIEIMEKGKKKSTLNIFYREPTKAERKEEQKKFKEFNKLNKKLNSIRLKAPNLQKKADLLTDMGKRTEALAVVEQIEAKADELEAILEEMETFGGDDFAETQAQERFEKLVSGKDVEKLKDIAESIGYVKMTDKLESAKADLQKEQ